MRPNAGGARLLLFLASMCRLLRVDSDAGSNFVRHSVTEDHGQLSLK